MLLANYAILCSFVDWCLAVFDSMGPDVFCYKEPTFHHPVPVFQVTLGLCVSWRLMNARAGHARMVLSALTSSTGTGASACRVSVANSVRRRSISASDIAARTTPPASTCEILTTACVLKVGDCVVWCELFNYGSINRISSWINMSYFIVLSIYFI